MRDAWGTQWGRAAAQVAEVPLVLDDSVESIKKTSKALELLKKVGALADVEKSKASKAIRRGKGACAGSAAGIHWGGGIAAKHQCA